jgi:predicted enzyme related to lactoylglutathione lyase
MSTTDASTTTIQAPKTRTVDHKLEVAVLPVADADRAKAFYSSLGWREDGDVRIGDDYRILQFTPTGSQASIIFGTGVTSSVPGSGGSLVLAVADIDAARADLVARGVAVSEVFHDAGGGVIGGFRTGTDVRAPGRDPEGRSYASYATFSDPDGNEFLLQELTTRFPGRTDIPAIAELLHETAEHHDAYEKSSSPHDWWHWYAAYFDARQAGSTPEEASVIAGRYMEEAGLAVPR